MKQKYLIDTKENKLFLKEMCENLLNFGHQFPAPDGTCYYLGDDGTPWKSYNRDTFETCRMSHVYTIGKYLGHEGSEELIDAAVKGLSGAAKDKENGGWYSSITPDGGHVDNKLCYVHAFVILAASGAALAGHPKGEELLQDALDTYDRYFWNEEDGMACDTWNTEFTELDPYRGLNANMHTVEAFLAAADVTGDERYRDEMRADYQTCDRLGMPITNGGSRNIIQATGNRIWSATEAHPDDQFKPYGATPGHGLEWARLITQWALSTYKKDERKSSSCILRRQRSFLTGL